MPFKNQIWTDFSLTHFEDTIYLVWGVLHEYDGQQFQTQLQDKIFTLSLADREFKQLNIIREYAQTIEEEDKQFYNDGNFIPPRLYPGVSVIKNNNGDIELFIFSGTFLHSNNNNPQRKQLQIKTICNVIQVVTLKKEQNQDKQWEILTFDKHKYIQTTHDKQKLQNVPLKSCIAPQTFAVQFEDQYRILILGGTLSSFVKNQKHNFSGQMIYYDQQGLLSIQNIEIPNQDTFGVNVNNPSLSSLNKNVYFNNKHIYFSVYKEANFQNPLEITNNPDMNLIENAAFNQSLSLQKEINLELIRNMRRTLDTQNKSLFFQQNQLNQHKTNNTIAQIVLKLQPDSVKKQNDQQNNDNIQVCRANLGFNDILSDKNNLVQNNLFKLQPYLFHQEKINEYKIAFSSQKPNFIMMQINKNQTVQFQIQVVFDEQIIEITNQNYVTHYLAQETSYLYILFKYKDSFYIGNINYLMLTKSTEKTKNLQDCVKINEFQNQKNQLQLPTGCKLVINEMQNNLPDFMIIGGYIQNKKAFINDSQKIIKSHENLKKLANQEKNQLQILEKLKELVIIDQQIFLSDLQKIIKKNPQLKYLGIYSSQFQGYDAPYQELQKLLNLHKFGSNGQLIFVDHWLNEQKIEDEDKEEGQIKTYFTNNKPIISDEYKNIQSNLINNLIVTKTINPKQIYISNYGTQNLYAPKIKFLKNSNNIIFLSSQVKTCFDQSERKEVFSIDFCIQEQVVSQGNNLIPEVHGGKVLLYGLNQYGLNRFTPQSYQKGLFQLNVQQFQIIEHQKSNSIQIFLLLDLIIQEDIHTLLPFHCIEEMIIDNNLNSLLLQKMIALPCLNKEKSFQAPIIQTNNIYDEVKFYIEKGSNDIKNNQTDLLKDKQFIVYFDNVDSNQLKSQIIPIQF